MSAALEPSLSLGSNVSNTPSCVSSVSREFRSHPYSPHQKKVWPSTCSTSSTLAPRVCSTSKSEKSLPTGPTSRTSSKKDAARAKCVAAPPSIRSRSPNGVFTRS